MSTTRRQKLLPEESLFDYSFCGVSLAHLSSLPVAASASFEDACTLLKTQTSSLDETSNRSYAACLRGNPETIHLVNEKATVFVSYAWLRGFGPTMKALTEHFADKLDETFVWMDFAVVDQHKAASSIDFDVLANTFKQSLLKIGHAVLVLTPGEKPIAISRSWCCFEWTMIVESSIPFTYCVPKEDVAHLVQCIHKGEMDVRGYENLFSKINVETAQAKKPTDRESILKLMKEIGVVKVNNIVMRSLKEWLVPVAIKAEEQAKDGSVELLRSLISRAHLHQVLGELNAGMPFLTRALECAMRVPNYELGVAAVKINLAGLLQQTKGDMKKAERFMREALCTYKIILEENHPNIAMTLTNLGLLLRDTGDLKGAESMYREGLSIYQQHLEEYSSEVAKVCNNLGDVLVDKGEFDEAQQLYREALSSNRKEFGDHHTSVASSENNLAGLLYIKGELEEAESLYKRALATRIQILGEFHRDVAISLDSLAQLVRDCKDGRDDDAKSHGMRAYTIFCQVLGSDHAYTQASEKWNSFVA